MSVQSIIEKKITDSLFPEFINIENESNNHAGPRDSETHFKVTVVSEHFTGLALIARHRIINSLLKEALAGPIHALALHTFSPIEWQKRGMLVRDSAKCAGKRP